MCAPWRSDINSQDGEQGGLEGVPPSRNAKLAAEWRQIRAKKHRTAEGALHSFDNLHLRFMRVA
jgi:hypothetical protein